MQRMRDGCEGGGTCTLGMAGREWISRIDAGQAFVRGLRLCSPDRRVCGRRCGIGGFVLARDGMVV